MAISWHTYQHSAKSTYVQQLFQVVLIPYSLETAKLRTFSYKLGLGLSILPRFVNYTKISF